MKLKWANEVKNGQKKTEMTKSSYIVYQYSYRLKNQTNTMSKKLTKIDKR